MAKAKITLKAAVDKAVSQSEGYRAISIFPTQRWASGGAVVLLKDNDFKTVEIPLE